MNKIYLSTLLLKLLRIKRQLGNPLSSTLGCKSYIFDEQFNTTEIKSEIDNLCKLDKSIVTREELTTYDPGRTEEILLWFQTDKCKTPTDKFVLENFHYNFSYEWLQMVNENRFVQNVLHYSGLIVNPLFTTSFILVITCIFIYYLLMVKFKLRIPLNSFVNILKNSILIRNNCVKVILSRLKDAKYIICISFISILLNLAIHVYNTHLLLHETRVLYGKIKEFKRQIQQMGNISERLCQTNNETVEYFMEKLTEDALYERDVDKWFFLINRGRIISDYFKIANKKNKLGKLFQLNGICCYMKL
jgi:hypothetical protein